MALKLGKCRLCLKLLFGDSYSIFTVDNTVQLAEMVMDCTRIKVYEGDGLPDKVCAECIQKLSSSYIFKQQCERADEELRRNYVPPPGFSPPPNRQSSDSAFSTHTDFSNQTKPSSFLDDKPTPSRSRKRSHESMDGASTSSRSGFRLSNSKRVEELRTTQKRPRPTSSPNNSYLDSDYEDNSVSHFSAGTDSDEPLLKSEFSCQICSKTFKQQLSLNAHMKIHPKGKRKENSSSNSQVENAIFNSEDAHDEEEKLGCEKCGKTFKLKIMLKRHHESCGKTPQKTSKNDSFSPQKELLISLEPIDKVNYTNKYVCEYCTARFKTVDNLEKHLKVIHAAVLKKDKHSLKSEHGEYVVPCLYCQEEYEDYYLYCEHLNACPQKADRTVFECPKCKKVMMKKCNFINHLKNMHFDFSRVKKPMVEPSPESKQNSLECRMCGKKMASQELLIKHLATHMSNVNDVEEESRPSTVDDAASVHSEYSGTPSGPLACRSCGKNFKYKRALETHEARHASGEIVIKAERPDKFDSPAESKPSKQSYMSDESESSQEEGDDNTCEICEKQFSYKRLLLHHKRTKHHMSSGTKRAKVLLKDCDVKCLICDVEMKVSAVNEHNQKHISVNIKPRNIYTCIDCGDKFKSCSTLANHIKMVHRLKKQQSSSAMKMAIEYDGPDLADFCEVVVTKAEPLDDIQSHNGFGEVPLSENKVKVKAKKKNTQMATVNLTGLNCTICGKTMPTLVSLKRHINWHTNVGDNIEKKIECFVCKEAFRFQCHYKLHMRTHYTDPNLDPSFLTCTICNRRSKHLRAAMAHTNYHKQTRFNTKDYQCSICKRVFQYRKVYLSHMAIHYKRGDSSQNTVVGDYVPESQDPAIFDGTFKCTHCGKICDSENSLKCHMSWHKSKTLLFGARHECPICHVQFTNKRRQELHLRTHYEDENGPYKCPTCGKGYTDEDYYKRHLKGHNFDNQSHKKRIEKLRKDKVRCPICNRYYPDLVKLIRHLRRTHPESKMIKEDPDAPPQTYFSCKLCTRVFLDERRLRSHEEAHRRKHTFFICKFCGHKSVSQKNHNIHIKRHLNTKHIDNPLKCPKCDEHFIKGYTLQHHLRDAHGIRENWVAEKFDQPLDGPLKEFQCSVCLKILASKGNFERHLDYHNSLRCNYCYDIFTTQRFLDGHLAFSCDKRRLIGDTEVYPRKIKCYICYKAFHLQVKLDCHLRTQHDIKTNKKATAGKKEFICDYCFRVFENEDALMGHKIYHRTIGYYGCIYCERKFNTLTVYRKHKNHHFSLLNVDNPTKCEHCDETFVAFREMIYHMKDEHNDDKEWVIMPKESIEETCNICNKTFFNLHKHLEYHEQNRCKKCGEYFYSRNDYDNHLCTIESDEEAGANEADIRPKYEECTFCFKPLTRVSSKLKHDLIHKGSGSISCRFCSHKFKTMDAFNIHAWSHRNRKYKKKPLTCCKCGEKFVQYGPFVKHMRSMHKMFQKMHYRAKVKPERCVVCGDSFPNLHNHYRAHLLNQCQLCRKYFTSSKLFALHECAKEPTDPSKVFTCDEDLTALINSYIPKDLDDSPKLWEVENEDEEGEEEKEKKLKEEASDTKSQTSMVELSQDEESQNSMEPLMPLSIQSPIISDGLSLYEAKVDPSKIEEKLTAMNSNIISLIDDDDSLDMDSMPVSCTTITIDD